MILFLIGSIFVNFLLIVLFIYLGKPFWHEVSKRFGRKVEFWHVGKDRVLRRYLVKKGVVPEKVGVKDVDPNLTYWDSIGKTPVVFNVGDEVRSYDFFNGSYAEDVAVFDSETGQQMQVGRIYRDGDGPSKFYQLKVESEREKAQLHAGKNPLIVWILVGVLLVTAVLLVLGIMSFQQIEELVRASGGSVLIG